MAGEGPVEPPQSSTGRRTRTSHLWGQRSRDTQALHHQEDESRSVLSICFFKRPQEDRRAFMETMATVEGSGVVHRPQGAPEAGGGAGPDVPHGHVGPAGDLLRSGLHQGGLGGVPQGHGSVWWTCPCLRWRSSWLFQRGTL